MKTMNRLQIAVIAISTSLLVCVSVPTSAQTRVPEQTTATTKQKVETGRTKEPSRREPANTGSEGRTRSK